MKKKVKGIFKKAGNAMLLFGFVFVMAGNKVFASTDVSSVTNPLNNLKTLFFAIIAVVGSIFFGKGLMDFASSLPDRDSNGMKTAGLQMAGGALMAAISTVIALLFN